MKELFRNLVKCLIFSAVLMITAGVALAADDSPADMNTVVAQPHHPPSYWVSQMPEGPGRDVFIKRCSLCHDLQRTVSFSRPKEEWALIIPTMMRRGAAVQPDEFPLIFNYLTENFGPQSKPLGLIGMQPCAPSEWPKGSADFRTAVHGSYSIWASNQQGGTIDIIDPAQNKVVRRIRCISGPDRAEFSPDGNTAYVPDRVEHNVTVIDTRTGAIIKKIPVLARPNTAVITRDGKKLYSGIWPVRPDEDKLGYVEVIDTAKLEVTKILETKGGIHDTWMAPDGKTFLAMAPEAKFMNYYDTQSENLIYTCCTEATIGTMNIEAGPDGSTSRIFASMGGFVVFDAKTGKELERIKPPADTDGPFKGVQPNGGFHGAEVSADGKYFWAASQTGHDLTVYRYSLPDLKFAGRVHLSNVDQMGQPFTPVTEGSWLTVSPDGKTVYAARPGRDLIYVIDAASMKEVTRIPTGEYPLHISIWPRGTP